MKSAATAGLPLLLILLVLSGCNGKTDRAPLPDAGFGFLQVDLHPGQNHIPFFLKSGEGVKGLEFILKWDPDMVSVEVPEARGTYADFAIHARKQGNDQMKVLMFSMQSLVFREEEPWVFDLPVEVTAAVGTRIQFEIRQTVFAGGGSKSFEIPLVTPALSVD